MRKTIMSSESTFERVSAVRAALSTPYKNGLLCLRDAGLWDGVHHGYAVPRKNCPISTRLYSAYDAEWYVEDGELICEESHHDGSNWHRYRKWRDNVAEEDAEDLLESVLDGKLDEAELNRLTEPIGNDVILALHQAGLRVERRCENA